MNDPWPEELRLGSGGARLWATRFRSPDGPTVPAAIGRAVDAAARIDPPLAGATASQVVYLALVGRTDEARKLHRAMAEQLSDDPALAALGTWLEGR